MIARIIWGVQKKDTFISRKIQTKIYIYFSKFFKAHFGECGWSWANIIMLLRFVGEFLTLKKSTPFARWSLLYSELTVLAKMCHFWEFYLSAQIDTIMMTYDFGKITEKFLELSGSRGYFKKFQKSSLWEVISSIGPILSPLLGL